MSKECEVCGSAMKLQKRGKATKGNWRKIDIKRFECTNIACKHISTVYGGDTDYSIKRNLENIKKREMERRHREKHTIYER